MKTKKMFAMFAAAAMMLTTSCSNDETFEQLSNEAQVTFSLGLENAMSTRAISDGKGIDQLTYAIFDKEGKLVYSSEKATNFPFNLNVTLLKGETYTAVFWAQDQECGAYTVSDNFKTVTVDYEGLNNDEKRDAFFRSETFTVEEDATLEIVLKRPFAQLNVGVSEAEWDNAGKLGYTIAKSAVVIKNAATTLNLMDGTVSGEDEVEFTANTIPTETLLVDIDCDGTSEAYKYLSMSYFLAYDNTDGASKTTLEDLKFTFTSEDGKTSVLERGLENVPVQRNHRTNIIGFGEGLLTGNYSVKVVLDPLYDGEHNLNGNVWEEYKGIYTEEALAGQTIEIPAGWHIRNGWILEPMPEYWTAQSSPLYEKSYTIDGKGNTVTFEPYDYKFTVKNAFAAADGQPVIVKNLIFAGEHSGVYGGVYGGVSGRNGYNTTFENVKIVNNKIYCYNKDGSHPVYAFSLLGNATLNKCIIKGTKHVGVEKDKDNENQHVTKALAQGVYDILVPNNLTNHKLQINDSEIGSIYVKEQGRLIVSGNSVVDKIIGRNLVHKYSYINIEANANVELIDVMPLSGYSPKVNIKAGATVGTLQLNDSKATYITIEDGATVGKIIWNGTEYPSIADFKAAL